MIPSTTDRRREWKAADHELIKAAQNVVRLLHWYAVSPSPESDRLRPELDASIATLRALVASQAETAAWCEDMASAPRDAPFLAEFQPPGADKPQIIIAQWFERGLQGPGFYGHNVMSGDGSRTISCLYWGFPEQKLCIRRWARLRLPPAGPVVR